MQTNNLLICNNKCTTYFCINVTVLSVLCNNY